MVCSRGSNYNSLPLVCGMYLKQNGSRLTSMSDSAKLVWWKGSGALMAMSGKKLGIYPPWGEVAAENMEIGCGTGHTRIGIVHVLAVLIAP